MGNTSVIQIIDSRYSMYTGFFASYWPDAYSSATVDAAQKIAKLCQRLSNRAEAMFLLEFKKILDHLLVELQRIDRAEQQRVHLNEILTALFDLPPNILVSLIEHALFAHLRTDFIRILRRWIGTFQLGEAESLYFWNFNKSLHTFAETSTNIDCLLDGIADVTLLKQISKNLTRLPQRRKSRRVPN